MSKRKPLKIILLLLLALPGLVFWYLVSMPSISGAFSLYELNQSYSKNGRSVLPDFQTIEVGTSHPSDGEKLNGYGYTLAFQGTSGILDKTITKKFWLVYEIADGKVLILANPDEINPTLKDVIYQFGESGNQIDYYLGRHLDTQYDCYMAVFRTSFGELSYFDDKYNQGLLNLLRLKINHLSLFQHEYQFDDGSIKGVLFCKDATANGAPITSASVFSVTDLNREYHINFLGYTPEEAATVLSTFTFASQE